MDDIKPEFVISSEASWDLFQARKNARSNVLLGLFFGVAIVLALINFIYFFIHHEKAYLQYTIYIFTIIYFEASRYGVVDLTPLIKYPILYLALENLFLILTLVYYLLFLKSFINPKKRYPIWNTVTNWLIIVSFIGLIVTLYFIIFQGLPLTAIEVRNYFLLLTLPVAGLFFINLAIKGNKIDKIFLLGSIVLVGTGMISLILDLFFKDNLYPDMIFQIGVIIELTIFSIGLGVKSRTSEMDKQEAQQRLIEQLKENEKLQRSINQELEKQVEERTREIQAQNEELLSQQEELSTHRDMLEGQNKMIARNNRELEEIKRQLEDTVESRTQQLKNANQELVQRNNQLEQYAYITAHNLRAPVARLKGLVYIFKKLGAVSKKNMEIVEKISNSALEMDEVLTDINKILELKNSNYSQTHSVEITTVIKKVEKILSDSLSDSHATLSTDFRVSSLHANEPYLESIFYNLISNAIKYQDDSRDLRIDIRTLPKGNKTLIEFMDNGVGIDLEKFGDKMFGLYQRFHDHVSGKGMGLYLVKTQVEALGGTISIESNIGKGTKFIIELPA
jgi:signal transduction histidine kinase